MIDNISATYKEFIDEFIKINNRLHERQIKYKKQIRNYNPLIYQRKGNIQRSINHYEDHINLDAMQYRGVSRLKKLNRFRKGPRDNNEREKYRRKNLCYKYRKSGHQARKCDTQLQGLYIMNIGDITGIIAKKADTIMEIPTYEEVSVQKALERSQEEFKKAELE